MTESRNFPFPVLSPASLDWRQEVAYSVEISGFREGTVTVGHQLTGDNFIAELLEKGEAVFACVVALPSTMYRKTFIGCYDGLTTAQSLDVRNSGASDKVEQLKFRPVIIKRGDCRIAADRVAGLDAFWRGEDLFFPDRSIIAFTSWQVFDRGAGSLLRVHGDDRLEDGEIRVEESTEGGFRFLVKVNGKLLSAMQESPGDAHVVSILTHALSRGLEILSRKYALEEGWTEYPNLQLLAEQLKSEGLPHWREDGFEPEYVATYLHPHKLNRIEEDEDDI